MPASTKQADTTNTTLGGIQNTLGGEQKGIVLNKPKLKNDVGAVIEGSTLEAMRQALWEYYLYNKLDPTSVLQAGVTGGKGVQDLVKNIIDAKNPGTGLVKTGTAPPNAVGGTVLKPPAGEAFASVAPGEVIVPKGGFSGGGGSPSVNQTFQVGVDANFAKYIDHRTKQAIVEWSRKAPRT
jgi:hypothetical protein